MDKINSKFKNSKKTKVWVRVVSLAKATREWDIDFWQSQKPKVRFLAAWDMIADFYRIRGKRIGKNTLRLQRTVENIKQA